MDKYEVEYYRSSGKSNFPSCFYIEAEGLDEAKKKAKSMLEHIKPILPRIKRVSDGEWVNLEDRV